MLRDRRIRLWYNPCWIQLQLGVCRDAGARLDHRIRQATAWSYSTTMERTESETGKVFGLVKAPDPDQQKIFNVRREVCEHHSLHDGAKVLFVRLLDLALNPTANNGRRGQIVISFLQLHERLHRSYRALWGWVRELVTEGYVRVTRVPMPNTHPMNCYHIAVLQQADERPQVAGDGFWGDGYRRPAETLGAPRREATGKFCNKGPRLLDAYGRPISRVLQGNSTGNGKKGPLPIAKSAVGSSKICYGERQNLLRPIAEKDPSQRQNLLLPVAKSAIEGGKKGPSLGETQYECESSLEKGGTPAPDAELERWLGSLDDMFPSALRKLESDLQGKLNAARSQAAKKMWRARLAAVRERLLGGPVPDEAEPPAPKASRKPKPMPTEQELLDSARSAIRELGLKPEQLTEGQRAALRKAGEL
jgi:hypothetical protein